MNQDVDSWLSWASGEEQFVDSEALAGIRRRILGLFNKEKKFQYKRDTAKKLLGQLRCGNVTPLLFNPFLLAWNGDKFGVVNTDGDWLVPCEMDEYFDDEYGSNHHILPYRKGDKWGLVISDGTVIEPTYDEVLGPGDDDFVEVRLGEQWGYILCDGLRFIEKKAWEEEGDDVLVWDIMA